MQRWIQLGVAVLAAGACTSPDIDALPYACEGPAECGADFTCEAGRCVRVAVDVVDDTRETVVSDTRDDVDAASCTPGDLRCADERPERCVDGVWITEAPCTGARAQCVAGVCRGPCVADETTCEGRDLLRCDDAGVFEREGTCNFVCLDGACGGVCTPTTRRCEGDALAVCDEDGAWDVIATCDPGACRTDGCLGCEAQVEAITCSGKCGVVPDNCGDPVSCSAVNGGVTCASAGLCDAGDAADHTCCEPRPVLETCADKCGLVRDNCAQAVNCGDACAEVEGHRCGATIPNVCGCALGEVRCAARTPQSCDAAGVWVSGQACPFVCTAGACAGACEPGVADCNGNIPRTCDALGVPSERASCSDASQTCSGGSCVGVCIAGTRRCGVDGPELCDDKGTWQSAGPCGTACLAGECIGVCRPGTRQCNPGASGVQLCDERGAWADERSCDDGCFGGSCCQSTASICTGDPGALCGAEATKDCGQPVTCDSTCDAGFSCGAAQAGRCGCPPSALRCNGNTSQRCNGTAWVDEESCGSFCLGATGDCAECQPGEVRCNGNTAETCGGNGYWSGGAQTNCSAQSQWCIGGACQGVCAPGQVSCLDFSAYVPCEGGQFVGAQSQCYFIDPYYACQDTNPDFCGCYEGSTRCLTGNDFEEVCVGGAWQVSNECVGITTCCEFCTGTCTHPAACTGEFCFR